MRIHLQSDAHLEKGIPNQSTVASDVCVLAGDIGSLQTIDQQTKLEAFFEERKDLAEHVIWVLGNHEFYGMQYEETLSEAYRIAKKCGVHLLDEAIGTDNLEIDGVKFWGSTLWSDLRGNDWFVNKRVADNINDFHAIKHGVRNFSTHQMVEINRRTRDKINWDADVIVTHFPPVLISNPRFSVDEISYYFYNSGLDNQILDSSVKLWLFGHTHHSVVEDLNGTLVASNQHGYRRAPNWFENTGYVSDFILEI
jgi:predicted phosphodiesterase